MAKKILVLIMAFFVTQASAATIEVKDPADMMETYTLFGAAYVCQGSNNLSTMERLEMTQIWEHYKKVAREQGLQMDYNIARGAAKETFGITTSNATMAACSAALKN